MAYASLTITVERVMKLLTVTGNFISAAEDELQQLKTQLNILQSFLEQAAKLPTRDERFREAERQIMEVADTIEKEIESSLSEAQNCTKLLPRIFNRKRLNSLAQKVMSLTKNEVEGKLEEAKNHFDKMLSGVQNNISSDQKHKHPCLRQHKIVCFKNEQDTIIKYLTEEKGELDVISIIGMAGLGKTTLAWQIFHNLDTQSQFPVRIWVSISPDFKCKTVLLEILSCFIFEDMSGLTEKDLSHKVHSYLEGKRFLLVIDDVWSIDVWNAIRDALPKTNRESKVLITSRYTNVGRRVNYTREPYHLQFLTTEESWELLELEAFGRRYGCPKELEEIDSHIAEQCDGLPLAIRDMGVLLAKFQKERQMSENKNEWDTVSKNTSYVLERRMQKSETLNIIASSYNTLPHDLRDCFLYLGVFPEKFEIPVWTLINLWIAEGLIYHKWGKSLEETAEENLKDLIGRNLVMVEKTNHMGRVKTCRLHVAIRVFCRFRAARRNLFLEIKMSIGGHPEPLFQEVKMSTEGQSEPSFQEVKMSTEGQSEPSFQEVLFQEVKMSTEGQSKHRSSDKSIEDYDRICIHSGLSELLSTRSGSKNLHSLLCFYRGPLDSDAERISSIPDASFPMLRVLATNSVNFTEFLDGVTKLSHLSYIALCGNVPEIPEAISELRKLQTIVVDTKSSILKIKANIWRMILLKHVKTKAEIVLHIKERKVNVGENLRTLSRLSPNSCTGDVSSRAPNLKKLGIRGQLANLDAKCLRKLVRLENLKLVNDSGESASQNQLHGLPDQSLNCFPGNLKMLTLSATKLCWQLMSKLGKIDTLQVLKLTNYAFIGPSWNCTSDPSFRRLEFLLIATTDLVTWEVPTDHFPSLRCLALKSCEKLRKIPMGLAKSLKKLDIESVSESAVKSAREIHEKGKASGFKLSIKCNIGCG